MADVFYLIHPPFLRDPNKVVEPVLLELPVVPGKALHQYYDESHLNQLRTSCRVSLDGSTIRPRTSYVPKAGDVVRLVRTDRPAS